MEWFESNATALAGLGGLAAVVACVVAVLTLMSAGLDSASRSRPYVVIEYEITLDSFSIIELVVRNVGPTAARNLRVTFDPPFEDSSSGSGLGKFVARRYATPIPVIGPGQVLRSPLVADIHDESGNDVPEELTAIVTYAAPWWRRNYRDRFELKRAIYTAQVFRFPSDSEKESLKKVAKALEKQVAVLDRLQHQVLLFQETLVAALSRTTDNRFSGVVWSIRQRSGNMHVLENLGTHTAFNVKLQGSEGLRVALVRRGQAPLQIAPGEGVAVSLGFGGGSEFSVSWSAEQESSEEATWTTRLSYISST